MEEIKVGGRIILKLLFKFEWQEVKSTGLFQNGDNNWAFVVTVINVMFQKEGGLIFIIFGKASFLNIPLHITQFRNTYTDPVCPEHLILRYCSCNTYLLHRRAELKTTPGST